MATGDNQVIEDPEFRELLGTRRNVAVALTFADVALVIDNSAVDAPYRLVQWYEGGHECTPPNASDRT